jgi:ketosteroid isomerase-like protein
VDSDWDRFISRCHDALGELVEGRPEPFKALWSHADDVTIMGAFGGYEQGWEQVSARLDWAATGIKATGRVAENVVTVVGDDLAYTVDLEHMTRHAAGQPTPRTLRCTQAYRRETASGKSSCATLMSFPTKTISKDDPPAEGPADIVTGVATSQRSASAGSS